jgi:hypothetical protein
MEPPFLVVEYSSQWVNSPMKSFNYFIFLKDFFIILREKKGRQKCERVICVGEAESCMWEVGLKCNIFNEQKFHPHSKEAVFEICHRGQFHEAAG